MMIWRTHACRCLCHRNPPPFRVSWRERLVNWLLGRPLDGWAVQAARYANELEAMRRPPEGFSMMIYGGSHAQVLQQLACQHLNQTDVCIDQISRYRKCLDCLALDRDVDSEEEYYAAVAERRHYNTSVAGESIDNAPPA